MKKLITNRGVIQVLLAFMLVISIMSISNLLVHRNSISGIYEKVSQVNDLAAINLIQTFDNNFRTIYNLIYAIHGINVDHLVAGEKTELNMSQMYNLQDQINNLINSIDYIEEAIVFYDDIDLAITSYGTSSFKHLFNTKYKHPTYNADYWRNYMVTSNHLKIFEGEFFVITNGASWNSTYKKLMVITGSNKVKLSNKNIILLIDERSFMKEVQSNLIIPGSAFVVMDEERRVIASTDPNMDLTEIYNDVLFQNTKQTSLTKEDYEYHIFKSDFNDFIYIEKLPYQFKNIESVTVANNHIMLISILSAVTLAILLSVYLNRPIRNILKQLGSDGRLGNDFSKIHSGVIKMQQEIATYEQQVEQFEREVERAILSNNYNMPDQQHALNRLFHQYIPEFFRSKYFVVVAVHYSEEVLHQEQIDQALLCNLLLQMVPEEKRITSFVLERTGRYVALIGLEQATDRTYLLQLVARKLKQLFPESSKQQFIWAAVSKMKETEVEQFRYTINELSLDYAYRKLAGEEIVMDMEKIAASAVLHYPYEEIEKVAQYLWNGKYKECRDIFRIIIEDSKERQMTYYQCIHIVQVLFYAMLKYKDSNKEETIELVEIEQALISAVHDPIDGQQMERLLYRTAKVIGAQLKQSETVSKLNPSFVSQYIELHYMENLYLDDIAAVTHTTPKYFSNYFKKTFGINYIEYLNKVRLSHAREMLKETNLTIAEIGEKTGYTNASTFATTFKKYYGVAPSEYRKQNNE